MHCRSISKLATTAIWAVPKVWHDLNWALRTKEILLQRAPYTFTSWFYSSLCENPSVLIAFDIQQVASRKFLMQFRLWLDTSSRPEAFHEFPAPKILCFYSFIALLSAQAFKCRFLERKEGEGGRGKGGKLKDWQLDEVRLPKQQ